MKSRQEARVRRRLRVRRQLERCERPLLTVYRSGKHIYAQLSDPLTGATLTGASTLSQGVRDGLKSTKDVEAAKKVGAEIARRAAERDIKRVSFNRNGFLFTGRIKALAEAARESGLEF